MIYTGGWCNNPSASRFASTYRVLLNHAGVCPSSSGNVKALCDDTDSLENNLFFPNEDLSFFSVNAACYIAGWVVMKILSDIHCPDCKLSLVASTDDRVDPDFKLISLRDNGGLVYPSKGVKTVIKKIEQYFKASPKSKCTFHNIKFHLFLDLGNKLFQLFPCNKDVNSHILLILDKIILKYVNIKQLYYAKILTLDECKCKIIYNLNKQIIFKGQ